MSFLPAYVRARSPGPFFSIARYTRFYLDFFKFNEDEVVSLDDILGADLVNKENIVKQLGIGSDTLVRLLGAITQNRRQHTADTDV
mmetsp:Transcript_149762/g.212920  ORF Transcript_149762/g.212920 Transcript_149762/m.212920 type:complete len:86 (-) Transcript_149762:113-370(-)